MPRLFVVLLCFVPFTQLISNVDWKYGFAGLAGFGNIFEQGRLPDIKPWIPKTGSEAGYDGQFYAQIALDPTLRHPGLQGACDNLAYRAQRIGMPAASYIMGFGQPRWIVQAYGVINFLAWIALLVWFVRNQSLTTLDQRFLAIALLWSSGTLLSMSRALTDLPSLCLSVIAIQCLASRPSTGSLLAAGALLTKETAFLSLLGFISVNAKKRGQMLLQGCIIVFPLVCWLLYVRYHVGSNEAGYQNFAWPFTGWLEKLRFEWILAWERFPRVPILEMLTPICIAVQTVYLLSHPRWRLAWWRMGIGFAALSVFLAHPVWENQNGYTRVLLPMTFAFNMQLASERAKHERWWYWLGNACLFNRAIHGLVIWAVLERFLWPRMTLASGEATTPGSRELRG